MKMLKLIALIALIFHGQSIIAMQALKAKQEKIAEAVSSGKSIPAAGEEIAKIEEITDQDEKQELFDEINQKINDEVTGLQRNKKIIYEILKPTISELRNQIVANASKIASSNRAKIIDSRSKIRLLCYAFQMFLDIDQGQNNYSREEKNKKKAEIWSMVMSAGLNYPMPANDVIGTSAILQNALALPMYQELADVSESKLSQVTVRKELEAMINDIKKPIQEAYNTEDKKGLCVAYDYLKQKFDDLTSQKHMGYSLEQSKFKIELLITFQFLCTEITVGCFKDQDGKIVPMAERAAKRNGLKDDLWQKLKKAMNTDIAEIQGKRPDVPGSNWVLDILRQRRDAETRAFTNPIFKKP